MSVMRVALISLARRGGMVHFHGELVNAMSKMAKVVSITAKQASSYDYSNEVSRLLINTGRGMLGTFLNSINPLSWMEIIRVMKGSNADVFHLVASQEWNPIIAFFARVLGKPLVFSMHDPQHHLGTPVYMQISDILTAKMSDAIVVLSKLGKGQLIKRGFREDMIYHIPHGVYSFLKDHAGKGNHVDREKVILFFGRIEPYKGLDVLLKSFSQCMDRLPEWKLVVAGNGDLSPYSAYLRNDSIEIINKYLDDAEVAELMQRSRFVAIPYVEATQSGVIQAAYAFARPVIATDVGSLAEMVVHEKTGLLIKPNDVDELTRAIITLTSDPELCERMGKYAYEMSRREWGWEMVAQRHINMYLDVIAKGKV